MKTNLKTLTLIAAGLLLVLSSATTNAQSRLSNNPVFINFYTNKPCANPDISWVLWKAHGYKMPMGGINCDPGNYGNYTSAADLETKLHNFWRLMSFQKVTWGPIATQPTGRLGQVVSKDNKLVLINDYGTTSSTASIILNGGSNFVSHDGGSIVAQGGGNLISQDGSGYHILAESNTRIYFPNRYYELQSVNNSPPPQRSSDESILLCVSNTVRQIRGKDNGANIISFNVGGGTVSLTGNVLTQAYKDTLNSAAKTCGARTVNDSSLRVGR